MNSGILAHPFRFVNTTELLISEVQACLLLPVNRFEGWPGWPVAKLGTMLELGMMNISIYVVCNYVYDLFVYINICLSMSTEQKLVENPNPSDWPLLVFAGYSEATTSMENARSPKTLRNPRSQSPKNRSFGHENLGVKKRMAPIAWHMKARVFSKVGGWWVGCWRLEGS